MTLSNKGIDINNYIDGTVGHNKSDYSASFYIKVGHKIALAEMTFIDPEIATGYIELAKNKVIQKEMLDVMSKSSGILFFNRLNVPESLRNNGYGKTLLKEVLQFCKENNYFLINTASNYGDMGQENLIQFYEKNGMKLLHKNGLLAYHSTICPDKKINPTP